MHLFLQSRPFSLQFLYFLSITCRLSLSVFIVELLQPAVPYKFSKMSHRHRPRVKRTNHHPSLTIIFDRLLTRKQNTNSQQSNQTHHTQQNFSLFHNQFPFFTYILFTYKLFGQKKFNRLQFILPDFFLFFPAY